MKWWECFNTWTPIHGNDVVISISNVGMNSMVMKFFVHSTVKCGI